ncbi:MAG: GrdX protein [Tissierella sp.]|nr:GrdX protein [Tissierella sp.]
MEIILITNNYKVYKKYRDHIDITYDQNFTYLEILEYTRDKIHQGHELLTHPLSGSIKPNETPYKSILISKKRNGLDFNSLSIIEESIKTTEKFLNDKITPNWTDKVLEDFKVIDLSLIENVIDSL